MWFLSDPSLISKIHPSSALLIQLDWVGPIDNRPSTDQFNHFVNFFLIKKKIWKTNTYLTHNTWHVTPDTQHIVWDEHSLKFQLPSSSELVRQCLEDIWTKGSVIESVNESMNDVGDFRTAPATLGLLNL